MPYKDRTKQNEAMRLIMQEQRILARQMKQILNIPDRRRKRQ